MATRAKQPSVRRKLSADITSGPEDEQRAGAVAGPNTGAPRKKRRPAAAQPSGIDSTEQIRVRAYYLSLERNGSGGDPVADWLRAERDLNEETGEA